MNELTNEIIGAAIEMHIGLLINFNVKRLTMGIRRVHELPE